MSIGMSLFVLMIATFTTVSAQSPTNDSSQTNTATSLMTGTVPSNANWNDLADAFPSDTSDYLKSIAPQAAQNTLILSQAVTASQVGDILYVISDDPNASCHGRTPCYVGAKGLIEASKQATSGSEIRIQQGTFGITNTLVIKDLDITIKGSFCLSDPDWQTRDPFINCLSTVNGNLQTQNIEIRHATVMLDGLHQVLGRASGNDGGCVYITEESTVFILNTLVGGCYAQGQGSGVYINYTHSNHAHPGGSEVTIINSYIVANQTGGTGGGIYCVRADVYLIATEVNFNLGEQTGGGMYCSSSVVQFIDSDFRYNNPHGMQTDAGTHIQGALNQFENNLVNGVHAIGTQASLQMTTFSGHRNSAIYLLYGGLWTNGTTFEDNTNAVSAIYGVAYMTDTQVMTAEVGIRIVDPNSQAVLAASQNIQSDVLQENNIQWQHTDARPGTVMFYDLNDVDWQNIGQQIHVDAPNLTVGGYLFDSKVVTGRIPTPYESASLGELVSDIDFTMSAPDEESQEQATTVQSIFLPLVTR